MDILKMLEEKFDMIAKAIEDKKALMATENDVVKQKDITTEILRLTREQGKVETEIVVEKNKLEAERDNLKAVHGSGVSVNQSVKVGTPGEYKGFRFRAELDNLLSGNYNVTEKMAARMKENPDKAEKVLKWFVDMYEAGRSGVDTKAALAEGATATGGALVQAEVRNELLYYIRDESIALQDAQRIPMNSNSLTIPAELANVATAFGAEADTFSESDPTFRNVTLTARLMGSYSVASNELIQDNFITGGIAAVLLPQFIEAIGQKVDSAVFIGSGADSAVFSGVFLTTGYSEVFGTGSSNFSELLESNVRNIVAKVPERYIRVNGKWYIHQSVLWQYFRGLKDTNGAYMFNETRSGQAAPDTLWGYPVRKPTMAKSTSAASTAMAVFGNLKGVMIGERLTDVSLFVDPYTAAATHQTKFYVFTRWGFAHALPNMLGRIVTAA